VQEFERAVKAVDVAKAADDVAQAEADRTAKAHLDAVKNAEALQHSLATC